MRTFKRYIIVFLIFIIIALGVATGYLYKKLTLLNVSPEQAAQREALVITKKVAKLIILPEGETPTIATVSDPDALSDQPFFAGAKKGDKVLIYTNAKKAILYDPVLDKIVNVAPLNIGSEQ